MFVQDVKTLKLTPNPAPRSEAIDAATISMDRAPFVCPLTLKEMNGVQPFVYISACGCVLSQAGLKTLTATKDKDSSDQLDLCPQCQTKFSGKDGVVVLNPSDDEEERLKDIMRIQRAAEPVKSKKSKKRKAESSEEEDAKSKKRATAAPSMNPSITTASKAVMSSLAMEEAKRKSGMSEAVKSLYGEGRPQVKETFMTKGTFTRVSVNAWVVFGSRN
jgi:hypothetical protein